MGCGQTGNFAAELSPLKLLKERILNIPSSDFKKFEKCEVPQRLQRLELGTYEFQSMPMGSLFLTEIDVRNHIKYLLDLYTGIKSSITCLYEVCHSECIKDFRIADSILIMLISISASNNGKLKLKFFRNPPYFNFEENKMQSETKKIYCAWLIFECKIKQLLETHMGIDFFLLDVMNRTFELEKVYDYIENQCPKNEPVYVNNKTTLAQATLIGRKLCKETKAIHCSIKKFVGVLKRFMNEVELYGLKAFETNAFSAEKIIHEVFCMDLAYLQ